MTAFNIIRFRVNPGHEEHFIAAHRNRKLGCMASVVAR